MTSRLGWRLVGFVCRAPKMLVAVAIGLAVIAWGVSTSPCFRPFGPVLYDWDLRLPSPDKRYDLVVIRGDAAAFDDFSYRIYLFPHSLVPADRPKGTQVEMTSIWRNDRYLVYSGYNYPMFRWTSPNSIELNLTDLWIQPFTFEPVKRFAQSNDSVLASLVFGREDKGNTRP